MNQRLPFFFLSIFLVVFLSGGIGGFLLAQRFGGGVERKLVPSTLAESPLVQVWTATIADVTVVSSSSDSITVEQSGTQLILPILAGDRSVGVDSFDATGKPVLDVMKSSNIPAGAKASLSVSFVDAKTYWVARILVLP